MQKSKFSEAQIVAIPREVETGVPIAHVWRQYGLVRPTFYFWQQVYGSVGTSWLQGLKASGQENTKLNHLYAALSNENTAIKHLLTLSP
jgi:putative transposase